jgi:RND superfamily putative drug exporter
MSSLLYSLGRWAYRSRRLVLVGWILALVVIGGLAGVFNKGLDNAISIPGTESQAALQTLAANFPQVSGSSAQLVVVAPPGDTINDPAIVNAVNATVADINRLPQISGAVSPFSSTVTGAVSDNGQAGLVSIQFTGSASSIDTASIDALQNASDDLAQTLPDGSVVSLGGEIFSQGLPTLSIVELIGVAVALIVLIFTFGSFLAAGMPLFTAILGVGISIALIFVATIFGPVTSTTPMLALMLGLAVGIDYALFIISRHQDQLRRGESPEESAARATATAGSAVIFAGLTVMIALLGLGVAGIPFLTTMGVAAAAGVGVAVLISVTLIPALLGFAGERLRPKNSFGGRAPKAARSKPARSQPVRETASVVETTTATVVTPIAGPKPNRFFTAWVKAVTRFPIVTIVAVIAAIGLLSAPALGLRLALPDAGALPASSQARVTYDLIAKNFGAGYNGPLIITGTIVTSTDPLGLMADLKTEFEKLPGVAAVPLSTPNEKADTGIVQVVPTGAPDSVETKALVQEIRAMHDYFLETYKIDIAVTGFTAVGIDVSDRLGNALLPFGLIVVGLSLILLTMVFRSIWVPVKAAVGYLLSVGASFGVVALVFNDGVFADLLHVDKTGPVLSFMPIILMGVLFGLAMDYEVFLVARMREDYVHSGDARRSIVTGFVGSAKVVTAAAIIMIAVFAAFVPEGDSNIKPIALGLAVGIFVDAFIVRMTFVPAVLQLLGTHAWWMPKWLDRYLPSFDVEGEGVQRVIDLTNWPSADSTAAIAAEGVTVTRDSGASLTADLFTNVSVIVPAGDTLIVRGEHALNVTALLLTLSGRLTPDEGKLKVTGLVLPVRSGAVRKRVGLVDAGAIASGDLRQVMRVALREHPDVIVIDGIDTVAAPEARAGVRDALSLAATDKRRRGRPLTIVVGTTTKAPAEALGDVLPNVEEAAVFKLTTPKKPASKKPASKKSAQTKSAQTKAKVTA